MMIFVIIGIDDGKILRPRTFSDENVAMAELRKLYNEKLAYYNDLAKVNNSVVNYSTITDNKAYIGAGFTRENYYEIQLHTTLLR